MSDEENVDALLFKLDDVFLPMKDNIEDARGRIHRALSGEDESGLFSGYRDLDGMTYGFKAGDLIVIGSRPGRGKTSLINGIIENVLLPDGGRSGVPVLCFNPDDTARQTTLRLLCSRARVDLKRINDRVISKDDMQDLATTAKELSSVPLTLDPSILNVFELVKIARKHNEKQRLGMIGIDGLHLIRGDNPSHSRDQQIEEICRELKALAKELDVPVIVTCPLNRQAEVEKRPAELRDLRGSGAIEDIADLVLLLEWDLDFDTDREYPADVRKCTLNIAKQRNGPTGSVDLTLLSRYGRFENFRR